MNVLCVFDFESFCYLYFIYIFWLLGGNGGHGNLVTMEYCNLTGNIAPSYGAAVAMAALQGYLDHSLLRETTYIDKYAVS